MGEIPTVTAKLMKDVLVTVGSQLCPANINASALIKTHVWRDSDYVGVAAGKVAVWRGWSINLKPCDDRFGTLYIDFINNVLGEPEQKRILGDQLAHEIRNMASFVYCFTTGFPLTAESELVKSGFVVRQLKTACHAGLLADASQFGPELTPSWSKKSLELLFFKRNMK